jgi:O-antigen/teichoic acid export membrane protein
MFPQPLERALRNSMVLLLAGRVLGMLLALLATTLLTRALGPEGFGFYRTIFSYLGLALVVADLGLNLVVVRDISRQGADAGRILGNAVTARVASAGLLLIVFAAAVWLLPLSPVVHVGIALGVIGSLALSIQQLLVGLFQQRLRQGGAVAADLVGGLLLVLLALLTERLKGGVVAFVLATLLSQLATAVVGVITARRLQPFRPRFEYDEQWRLLKAALPVGALTTLSMFYFRADILLLALIADAEAVGFYGLASRVLDALTGVTLLFTGLVAPLLARSAGQGDAAFKDTLDLGLTAVLVWTVGAAALLVVFGSDLAGLLGGTSFTPAGRPLAVLGIVAVVMSVHVLLRDAAIALNAQQSLLLGYGAAVVLASLAYLVLIRQFADLGAALGLLVGELTVAVAVLLTVRRVSGILPSITRPLRILSCGLGAVLAGLLVERLALWPVGFVLTGLAYAGLLLSTRTVAPRLVLQLLNIRGRRPA